MLHNGLPVFSMDLLSDDVEGISIVSLVDSPAIQRNFIAMAEQKEIRLSINDEKHIVSGPVIVPDQLIYRKDDDGKEYYISFSKEAIERIAIRFFSDGNANNVNLMHEVDVNGCVYFESYIVNHERGIVPVEFSDLPDGTWCLTAKINNEKVWELVKDGTLRGFSVEGHLDALEMKEDTISSLEELINRLK